jgi:hypothetical protein
VSTKEEKKCGSGGSEMIFIWRVAGRHHPCDP